jgi:hypothetical protein
VSVIHTPRGCCVEHWAVCDIHLQGVVLNIAECDTHTYRVLCAHWSVCDIHLQGVVLNIALWVIHTYRVFY